MSDFLAKLDASSAPDPVGPKYSRVPEGRPPVGPRGGSKLKFAKIVARKNGENGAWTTFLTYGFPTHYTAHPCNSAGGNIVTGTTLVLMGHLGATGFNFGFLAAVDAIVAYMPGDGAKTVPGDAETDLDGYIIPGVLGAKILPSDTAAVAPETYQPIQAQGGRFKVDWLRYHE